VRQTSWTYAMIAGALRIREYALEFV